MDRPTKSAFIGAAAAAAIIVAGLLNSYSLKGQLRAAQATCEAEAALPSPASSFGGRLVCEADVLARNLYSADYTPPPGVQGQLVNAQREVWNDPLERYVLVALAVLFVLCVPWLWYFLLRRLREVSAAVRGEP